MTFKRFAPNRLRMSERMTIAIGVVAIVAVAGLAMTPVTLVSVGNEAGQGMVCERVNRESTIALTFTHSMYGGDVAETYRPTPTGHLLRTSIVTGNAAAAEYYAWDGAVVRTADGFEVVVPDQEFDAIPIRVDQIGKHRLTIDGTSVDLAAMVDDSEGVRLALVTRPLAMQVLGLGC